MVEESFSNQYRIALIHRRYSRHSHCFLLRHNHPHHRRQPWPASAGSKHGVKDRTQQHIWEGISEKPILPLGEGGIEMGN